MYKLSAIIACFILLIASPLKAQELDYGKSYLFKLPKLQLRGFDYESEIRSYQVKLSKIDNKTFMIIPVEKVDKWFESREKPYVRGWLGEKNTHNDVEISGMWTIGEGYAVMELNGNFVEKDALKGNAIMRVGVDASGETPSVYRSDWCLEPEDTKKPIDISNKITYHGPPAKTLPVTVPSSEEKAKRPPIDDLGIKSLARNKPKLRERFYRASEKNLKLRAYYDKLLSELTWDEIKYTPGILLLVDHLSTLEEVDQKRIANSYVRDGSVNFFDEISYKELQRTPPLFLILKCIDHMKESDIEGLQEESSRFLKMLDAYKEIPNEELSDLTLTEFIIKISESLPIAFRKSYYKQSLKL
ncbi:MAG: hypothetical protein ACMUIM_01640 [bacterium]